MGKAAEGQAGQAAVFGLVDVVFDAGVAAVAEIQLSGAAFLVGEEHRQAPAIVVGKGQLVAVAPLGPTRGQP